MRAMLKRILPVILAGVAWSGGFLAYLQIVGPLSNMTGPAFGLFVSSLVCVAAAFAGICILLRGRYRQAEALAMVLLAVALNLAVYRVISGPAARMTVGFSLIVGGFGLGSLLAALVESPRYVLPMCVVAAVADVWSVLDGPTRQIIESRNQFVLDHVFVSYPAAAETIRPVAGVADLVFVGLFLCVAARLGLSLRRSIVGMFAGFAVGLAAAALTGGAPGLPFIGAGLLAANWKDIKPGRDEIVKTAVLLAVLLVCFAAISVLR